MKTFKKTCLLSAVIALTDIGMKQLFHIRILDYSFRNLPWISSLFHFYCLISAFILLLDLFEKVE